RQRVEEPRFTRFEEEDRQERRHDDEQREQQRPRDARDGLQDHLTPAPGVDGAGGGEFGGAVLHDDDSRVLDGANGDAQTGEREQVDRLAEGRERQHGEERAEQQDGDRSDRRPEASQEEHRDQNQDDQLGDERGEELLQRRPDPGRAIVGGQDVHARRQRGPDRLQLLLDGARDGEHVLVLLHHHDAAYHLAVAVEVGGTAP